MVATSGNVAEPIPDHRSLKRISRVAGILPWLSSLALAMSALYIRLMFGRWPRVYRDSPEFPLSDTATSIAVLAALSWPAMMAVAVLLPIVRMSNRARPVFDRWAFSSCMGAALLYLLSTTDPYGFLEWAFD